MTQVRFWTPGAAPADDQCAEAFGSSGGTVTNLVATTVSPGTVMKSTTME